MPRLDIDNACTTSANEQVGTTSLAAASCNLSHLDRIANSQENTSVNRVGTQQLTVAGLGSNFGFIIAGDFATGFTINSRNQVGQDASGDIWRYTGDLPFTVPAGTTPVSPDYEQLVETDHNNLTNRNAVGSHDGIYTRNFDNIANLKAGLDSSGQTIDMSMIVGSRVFWRGYFSESDGGSNWGIVMSGAHTEDGGRIISIDSTTYVQANMTGVINIRKWGCAPSLADNSTQWQRAQTYAETNTGGGTHVPAGTFTCLSPINIGFNGFVEGVGFSSRVSFTGVNAFNFSSSGVLSGRGEFKNFSVLGNSIAGTIAFNVDSGDNGETDSIRGLTFRNISCSGFEEAWRLIGARNTEFQKCETINCWHGCNILGRNIHIVFSACNFVRGTTTLGTGTSTGIRQAVAGGFRSEDIQIKDTLLFGFDWGIDITNCLVFHMEGCDLDFCVRRAARIVNIEGGGSIKSSWLFVTDDAGGEIGIEFVDIGTDTNSKFVVFDNNIERETAGTAAGITGIFVGTNHRNVEIDKNTIENFHTACSITSPLVKYTNNVDTTTASATVTISEFAERCTVSGNNMDSVVNRNATPHILFGPNEGVLTEEILKIVLDASNTTQTYTWASLGLPDGPANSQFIVQINSPNVASSGATRGVATSTNLTVYTDTALGAQATLDLYVKAF